MSDKAAEAIFIPMTLQAYVVSEDFINSKSRVAPLIQPDYAALRKEGNLLKHDVLEQLDVSSLRLKAQYNTRFVDICKGETYRARVGAYVSWCLPRFYRMGSTATGLKDKRDAHADYEKILLKGGYISRLGEDDKLEPGKIKVSTKFQPNQIGVARSRDVLIPPIASQSPKSLARLPIDRGLHR